MKAYKPVNLSFEKKVVFSYAVVLSFISFFILLSPVLAQNEDELQDNKPKVEIDVKKQFDENGNITGYDSSYSWTWKGENFPIEDLDSIFRKFHKNFDQFSFHFPPIPYFFYHDNPLNDSLWMSFHNFDNLGELFNDFDFEDYIPSEDFYNKFSDQHEDFLKRYNEYLKEHQKLIEKYFHEPFHNEDLYNGIEQNKYSPDKDKRYKDKSAKV